ncbi:hypothetical protein BCV71DRAFT_191199 [Rhizopus microsporus]|uniref:Uncharacterized protein n=1 Tax=Rhizopus microsporus TaxID=58291 RepID=A0A1X0RK46_RHIZD|nr:hypothetical protein BCV71DRAFT_191199 [Rhizopus microsporus]
MVVFQCFHVCCPKSMLVNQRIHIAIVHLTRISCSFTCYASLHDQFTAVMLH